MLELGDNLLPHLPPWLPPSLEHLAAPANLLTAYPDWAALRLTRLKTLDLHTNKISHVSRWVGAVFGGRC